MPPDRTAGPLSLPAYRVYWLSRLAATLAAQIQVVAVGWQMYELTGSALDLGLVGLVQFLPSVVLMFAVGPIVDRHDRRLILAGCRVLQGVATLALAAATAAGFASREALFAFVLVLGATRAFEMPTAQSLLPTLVPGSMLSRAVALASSAHQVATIGGPALGGLLYVAGPQATYAAAGLAYVVAGLMALRVPERRDADAPRPRVDRAYLFAGIAFIRSRPALLGAISLDMFAVLLGGATALLPIYAKDILHTGPWGLGLLRSAPAVGALAVALWLSRRPLDRSIGPLLFAAVAVFGAATVVFGLSTSMPLSFAALVVLGAADMVSVVIRMSIVQLETPDEMRGRVGAVNSVFIGASNQIGEFESGVVAAWLGPVPAVVLGGLGTLVVVAAWIGLFPALARRDRLQPASEGRAAVR
ncbi:MAG: MFS transporter [Burkholderiales bacterium]